MRNIFFAFLILTLGASTTAVGQRRQLKRIGVQLYTVREDMARDFEGTLRRVAGLGYDEVEFAGLFGRKPDEVRRLVEKLGMKIVSSHIGWNRVINEPEAAIAETRALGAKYMVLAWFPPDQRKTLDQWRNWIAVINRVAAMSKQQGIQFLYHNHDFEFKPIDGIVPFDMLLDQVDRRYVKFELDIYWLRLGGGDPDSLFRRYQNGFPLSHVKDMSRLDEKMVDVGDGRIEFGGVFKSRNSGMKHYFVEHDTAADPYLTLKRSLSFLRELRF